MTKKLLVIIVTYNSASIIEKCLKSLEDQTEKNFEILIVDNNSKDQTLFTLDKYLKKSGLKNSTTIDSKSINLGFAKAVNIGLRKVTESDKYYAALLLNPDTTIESSLFEEARKIITKTGVGAASPLIVYPDNKVWWAGTRLFSKEQILKGKNLKVSTHPGKGKSLATEKKMIDVEAMTGCSMFINSNAVQSVGLFDERFFMYCEDIDYSRRLHSHGYKTLCFTTSKVIHDIDDRQQLRPIKKFRKYKIYITSVGQYIRKHFGLMTFISWGCLLPFSLGRILFFNNNDEL
jgi:GT2 family glycosyltransferase